MRVVFDPDFDGGAWPGPLAERQACAGEAWVGEAGLLGLLETALGLTGRYPGTGKRAAALVETVAHTEGFWSRSAVHDPFGVARTLLSWRDRLFLSGWSGQAIAGAPRVSALAAAMRDVLPGIPDRLLAVSAALARRPVAIEVIETYQPVDSMPVLWRRVFAALGAAGVRIVNRAPVFSSDSASSGPAPELNGSSLFPMPDLYRARSRPFHAAADGSLQLLRSDGPLEAAEEIAAWLGSLAAADQLSGTIVIGSEPVLDWALRRHGLPVTDAAGAPEDNALLQLLPLVLALELTPADPARVLELLTLPHGPVPPSTGRRLARALAEWPAIGSDAWNAALAKSLAAIEDEKERASIAERLRRLFEGRSPAATGVICFSEVRERLALLRRWFNARAAHVAEPERGPWDQLAQQLSVFSDQVEHSGLVRFTASSLRRVVEQATADVGAIPLREAQAGLWTLRAPGALVASARRVVWWSFRRDTVRAERPLPFSSDEHDALAAAGVQLPDPTRQAISTAARWRRPLLAATEALVLVAPRRAETGDEAFPHPLWDEIAANAVERSARRLEVKSVIATPGPARVSRPLRPVVVPRRDWSVRPAALVPREYESPSGVASLIGCSLLWVLRHQAGVSSGMSSSLPGGPQLIGKMTHEILARVLVERCPPSQAQARAIELFDSEGPRLAAALFLPGAEADRAVVRAAASLSALALTRLLSESGSAVESVETEYERPALDTRLRGRADLVASSPLSVIDLKWSGARRRRDELKSGTATQLAAYSFLVGEGAQALAPVAYFILDRQELLSTDGRAFPSALRVDGASPQETWLGLETTYRRRWREMRDSILEAPGNADAGGRVLPEKGALDEETGVTLMPGCHFCDFQSLCGRAFTGESA